MEAAVDHLSELSRSPVELSQFASVMLSHVLQVGGARQAVLWMLTSSGRWQPVGPVPPEPALDVAAIEEAQVWLPEISIRPQMVFENLRGRCPIRAAGPTVAVLEAHYETPLSAATQEFLAALCEVAADFMIVTELRQLRLSRDNWQQWDQYLQRLLLASNDLDAVCAVIANDGRLRAECDRVSVLTEGGSAFTLRAISGVDRIEPRSSATRYLERLATRVAQHGQAVWSSESTGPCAAEIESYQADSSSKAIGLVPIVSERNRPFAIIVLEEFHAVQDTATWRARGEMLASRSSFAIRSAWERSSIPWLGAWKSLQVLPRFLIRPGLLLGFLLLAGIVGALYCLTAEFTVTGPAKLWPAHRREIFASTSGIIDQIHVKHGDEVQKDQPLLELRSPELEAETPRIVGQIARVQERLKGIQAARLSGGNSPDALVRSRQLATEEEELKQELLTLDAQQKLIEKRQTALTLTSPIAGTVLTWDITRTLSARPVERGQSLVTVGETAGPWIVEIRVKDQDVGPILRARQSNPEPVVDFLLPSESGRVYQGHIHDVALSAETDHNAQGYVRVEVHFDRNQISQLRPGATVIPRIHCGRRSLGYVWLHDLIEAIRTRILF